MKTITLMLLCTALAGSTTAWAADCRDTKTVDDSAASLQANADAGGHVSIHVKGQKTEAGKSQFASAQDFVNSFNTWRAQTKNPKPAPKTCGGKGGSQNDCVDAKLVGITSATVCKKVDKSGACTEEQKITPKKVGFWYANSKGTAGKWIVNTAYPSVNANCS